MGNKKQPSKDYRKAQLDTIKRMYDNRIFIDCFGTVQFDMYAEVTGFSEKKVRKVLKKLYAKTCNNFYKECKKQYDNPNTLLIRLFYSYLPLKFIAQKMKMTEEEVPNAVFNCNDEEFETVWHDLMHKTDRIEREEKFCRNYVIGKQLRLINLKKDLYKGLLADGNTEEEALKTANVDKETMDKYLSMTHEETEEFVRNEVNDLFTKDK